MFVDLHLHSSASDGTQTPAEVVAQARRHGLRALALADHNTTDGLEELMRRGQPAAGDGLRLLPGVELDAWHAGQGWHVLGYGFDRKNEGLQALCRRNREHQEAVNREVVLRLEGRLPGLTAAYDAFSPAEPGGWKLLHFLRARGLADTLHDGLRYYALTGVSADEHTFPPVAEVAATVHAAGGAALLAHPGADIAAPAGSVAFWAALEGLLAQGLDGVECFHPSHSTALEGELVALCRRRGLLIGGGSDCHGEFFSRAKQRVGSQFVPAEAVAALLAPSGVSAGAKD